MIKQFLLFNFLILIIVFTFVSSYNGNNKVYSGLDPIIPKSSQEQNVNEKDLNGIQDYRVLGSFEPIPQSQSSTSDKGSYIPKDIPIPITKTEDINIEFKTKPIDGGRGFIPKQHKPKDEL
ncbi:hypothetical protein DLAC_00416 [Tieghemostelium lacteum]|uniref:Uncharacterized protein n=1 Tax=Tieghemostelium lacteum TaxID=361077 RepID=A0A152A9N7_TIELA|nr:hypothetical protein DLAC_00416 [Tieghemostelium lacteum]|eukprot:KYR02936.1 hypothetical protein DLAC_00416 [Tieghemostelium lacteum]